MARRTDAEIGRLVRRACKDLRVKPRRLCGLWSGERHGPGAYLESDTDFVVNNLEVASAILDALSVRKASTNS